jgi:5'-deoxynucleotidase YfbR-like HD superfamily hydrolase
MTWMLTHTGSVVDLRLAQPHQISLLDIAHGLALTNRYNGQTVRPYSVAEHSLLVVEILEREYAEHDPAVLLAALLHDAHEAYLGDMIAPLKAALQEIARRDGRTVDDYRRIETKMQTEVLSRFGAYVTFSRHHQRIKRADLVAMATERRDLLPSAGPTWTSLAKVQTVDWVHLGSRAGLDWMDWRQAYLDKFAELYAMQIYAELPGEGDAA